MPGADARVTGKRDLRKEKARREFVCVLSAPDGGGSGASAGLVFGADGLWFSVELRGATVITEVALCGWRPDRTAFRVPLFVEPRGLLSRSIEGRLDASALGGVEAAVAGKGRPLPMLEVVTERQALVGRLREVAQYGAAPAPPNGRRRA